MSFTQTLADSCEFFPSFDKFALDRICSKIFKYRFEISFDLHGFNLQKMSKLH